MTAAEILRERGIAYVETRKGKYTTKCPQCGGGYLNVELKRDGVVWYCNGCQEGSGEHYNGEQQTKKSDPLGPVKAVYDYTDENGDLLFQALRFEPLNAPKVFRQRTNPDQKKWSIKGVRIVPFRLPELLEDLAQERTIFVVEGEKDVNTLREMGFPATCNPMGAGKWKATFNPLFKDVHVVICGDNDAPGRDHVRKVADNLYGVAADLHVLDLKDHWPEIEESDDITDWFEARHTVDELWKIVESLPEWKPETNGQAQGNGYDVGGATSKPTLTPCTIEETLKVFDQWLLLKDQTPVITILGAVAANLLPGDPVWLGIIAPPSSAKTEILNSISMVPNVVPVATLTPAGLLSGTSKRLRDVKGGACGGLLRQIGEFGIIMLKDFGSVLSMRPDAKAETIAALREVYDGSWTRVLGTDGGRSLHWSGKIGLVFGATGVIDSHHGVIGAMGDRFLFSRLAPLSRGQFNHALKHVGPATKQMRKELAEAVAGLFAGRRAEPQKITDDEIRQIDAVISLAVRLRGAVERDRHSRQMESVLGAEGTARIGLSLERLLAGLDTIGVPRATAIAIVKTVALDSVPPLRLRAYDHLRNARRRDDFLNTEDFIDVDTSTVAQALGLPTNTVRRVLEDLAAYGLIECRGKGAGKADKWIARQWEDDR
jgi:hypothetical protein